MIDRMNPIAPSVAKSGPNDQLAAVDVYKVDIQDGTVINSLQDKLGGYLDGLGINKANLAKLVAGGKSAAKLFPIVKSAIGAINSGNLSARILAATNLGQAALTRLPEGMQETIGEFTKEYGDTFVLVKDVYTRVASTDINNLNSVGRLINDLTGHPSIKFEDGDGLAGVLVGTIHEATRFGIPNSFDTIAATIGSSDMLMRVSNQALPIAIDAGDIKMLRSINTAMGSGNLMNSAPGVIQDFTSTYSVKLGPEVNSALDAYPEILSTFNEIDAEWNTYYRLNETTGTTTQAVDGMAFVGANPQMKATLLDGALTSATLDDQMLVVAMQCEKDDVFTALARTYPLSVSAMLPSLQARA